MVKAPKTPQKRRKTSTRAAKKYRKAIVDHVNLDPANGRPSNFQPEYVEWARKLCLMGATDIEIADFLKVNVVTLYRWKAEHEQFSNALTIGKESSDNRVERSLYWRANGYEHEEVDIRVVNGEVVQTPIRKFYPPDTAAAIFWLKNRRKLDWRDNHDLSLSGALGLETKGSLLLELSPEVIEQVAKAFDGKF